MTDTPEIFASECCGGLFVPGTGPDNIVGIEAGTEIVVQHNQAESHPDESWKRVREIPEYYADEYDAIRAGECPACGQDSPYMTEVEL